MLSQFAAILPARMVEHRIERWLARWAGMDDLAIALVLWNGRRFALGAAPRVVLRLTSPRALPHLLQPSLSTLGAAYVEGLLDIEGPILEVIQQVARLAAHDGQSLPSRAQRHAHSRQLDAASIQHHYDVSNEFYRLWLDEDMVYSCAYFRSAQDSLAQAQQQKIDHILRKIRLQPGQRLLDVGCGWGALVLRAASAFGARCVGVTLSHRQFELASERVRAAGLSDRIEIRLQDYRDVAERYDRVTSVGMFEHVGLANLPDYFVRIGELLADDGVAMNHGITSTDPDPGATPFGGGDFIDHYVFPNGELPHIGFVLEAISNAGLEATDIENLRLHYALTLREWSGRFEHQAHRLLTIAGERRFRIWRAYLAGCAYAFEHNWVALHQILVCKPGRLDQYPLPLTRDYMYPP